MQTIVYGQDSRFIPWAEEVIGVKFRDDARTIGRVDRSGNIIAAVVFDTFSECDVNIHCASDGSRRWLTRDFLVSVFSFPFIQCGLRRITGIVASKNLDSIRFILHCGFSVEGRLHDAMPDDDVIIFGLRRADCRFIPKEYRL